MAASDQPLNVSNLLPFERGLTQFDGQVIEINSGGVQIEFNIPTVSEIVELLVSGQFFEAQQKLETAFRLLSPPKFLLEWLTPLQIEIGELWHSSAINVATEHAITALLRQQLESLLVSVPVPTAAPLIVCACAPGELHELGILSLVFFLRQAGLNARYWGANLPASELLAVVERFRPAGVCLSAATLSTAMQLTTLLYQLADVSEHYPMVVSYGGRFFNFLTEAKRASLPGLYIGPDAAAGSILFVDRLSRVEANAV
jgi:MerR family transcriptional regulator, light-induced transcriptional regulator